MPIERKAWACKWGCATKVLTSRIRMERHEDRCWQNPARMACASCANFVKERDGNGMDGTPYNETWTNVFCLADENIIFGDDGKQLRHDCPLW